MSTLLEEKTFNICVVGHPNAGKTTLFNGLTGLRRKTGNYQGVTVDSSSFVICDQQQKKPIRLIDLPGIRSLRPTSADEKVAVDVLTQKEHLDYPDHIFFVADAFSLSSQLYLLLQLMEKGHRLTLILSMWDDYIKSAHHLDVEILAQQLGIEVLTFGLQTHDLKIKLLASDFQKKNKEELQVAQGTLKKFEQIEGILKAAHYQLKESKEENWSKKIDQWSTHPFWGMLLLIAVLTVIFQGVYVLSAYPMTWIEQFFKAMSVYLVQLFPSNPWVDFVDQAILSGLSGVIMFVPQIAILFWCIHFLEESGYMPRVSFLLDRIMNYFGLSGKSVIPLINGYACAVPAIMAARTITSVKERKIAWFIIPFMTCSARLPVYTLFIGLLAEPWKDSFWGLQGLLLTAMYLLGLFTSLGVSWFFSRLLPKDPLSVPFFIEIPRLKIPSWKSIFISTMLKTKIFLRDAGKIILMASVFLWFLGTYKLNQGTLQKSPLEASFLGQFGQQIEPVLKPLGYDWKIGVAILSSFAAREVFVGTLSMIYGLEENGEVEEIALRMKKEVNPQTGQKKFSLACCISLLLFYAFAMQCVSTMAVVYRETKSWGFVVGQFVFMLTLAYSSAYIAYNILST